MTRKFLTTLTLAASAGPFKKSLWVASHALLACSLLSACEKASGPEAELPPLSKWTFSGHEITYKSGVAVRGRDFEGNLSTGITVWLTDRSIDCSSGLTDQPLGSGGWIGIKYPEISLGKGLVRVDVGYWPSGPGLGGNLDHQGSATLLRADTAEAKMVSGSLDFHSTGDPEDGFGKADITGSFTVPYCPE